MRLHPVTVPVRSLSRSLSAGTPFFVAGLLLSPGGTTELAVVGATALVALVGGVAYELLYYRRYRYELTGDTFDVTAGVVSRRDREVPLGRVQSVDVRQGVVGRALGVAAVSIETAGGDDSEVAVRYVDEREARRLQRELRHGAGAGTDDDSREELLFELRPRELAVLSAFTIDPGASLVGGIALSFASGFAPERLVPAADVPGTGTVALAAVGFLAAAWAVGAAVTAARYYGFRLVRVGDELRYERGLFQRYGGTIPATKVQTLTIGESVPLRWFGYASLAVETAGDASDGSDSRGTASAIPLADRDRVRTLARSIEPYGDEDTERLPLRARERYAVRYVGAVCALLAAGYVLAAHTAVVEDWHAVAALLPAVPVAAHCKWASRGFRVDERYFLARTGFWRRTTKVVPCYRVQSVVTSETPLQRRRRLATVTADTAGSASFFGRSATAFDLDRARALELARTLEGRLQERIRERRLRRGFGRLFDGSGEGTGGSPTDDGSGDDVGSGE